MVVCPARLPPRTADGGRETTRQERMKVRGGYDVPLAGRPAAEVLALPEPAALELPLRARRLHFADVRVADGARVGAGDVLAVDAEHFGAPLLAPRGGTVRLGGESIALSDLTVEDERPWRPGPDDAAGASSPAAARCRKLVALGAWQFFEDAYTGELPDPAAAPRAVIVSTTCLEPFGARGDAQLARRVAALARGLEHLQSLLEYQPMYLVVPAVRAALAEEIHDIVRGRAQVEVVTIPARYPHDNFALVARRAGLKRGGGPVWALRTEGVLAVDHALTADRPCTVRIVAVGGPGVARPAHVKAMAGYPLRAILRFCGACDAVRVLAGGAMTGLEIAPDAHLHAECTAVTVLPDRPRREMLGFARAGADRQSYDRTFLSRLRRPFAEALTTELRGERRACIACGLCEDVCPAGIWPHLIHKLLSGGSPEGAERARVDLCVRCGLCSYVCPSKIELMGQFIEAQRAVEAERAAEREHRAGAAAAQAAAARQEVRP